MRSFTKIQYLWFFTAFISLLGLVVTTYLTILSIGQIEASCSIQGCNEVLNSKWAKLLGIPLSFGGMLVYGTIMILSLSHTSSINILTRKIILLSIFIGMSVSVYLTYIEIFVIKALCQYCITSAILLLINSIIIIIIFKKEKLFISFHIWQVLFLEDEAKVSANPQNQR